ncbi:MAG: RNA polymerase sigma-70 factor [Tannerellaceae bacterium]|jgi:RNA polymerase sigma-70 factor (ECF subfamily)|nr:RNA polymerase sigma-70 factor [Tannerellaceae bacterium]
MRPNNRPDIIDETATLIKKITVGDEVAFKQLFALYYQQLFHSAIYFLKSKELAEEVVADIFFHLWVRREMLTTIDDIDKYLYVAVKNQSIYYLRRKNVMPNSDVLELYNIEWIPDSDDPEGALLNREYEDLIQQAIFSLPEKCREVFRLVLSDRLKHKDIAHLLDISEKTVEAHVANAYKRIVQFVTKKYTSSSTKKDK